MKKKKKDAAAKNNIKKTFPIWFYGIALLIPILLVITLEISLRYFDYGKNLEQWIDAGNGKYMLNNEIAFRYFYDTESIPYPIGDLFDIEKKPNSFRIFVLGASTAAGYPFTPSGTFSKYIKKRLELEFPDRNIEVVNLAFAAINSYTLLDFMPEIIEQKPDLILIYAGHNEYYGALGAGSSESLGNIRPIVKLMLSMNKFKTTQFFRDIIKKILAWFSTDNSRHGTLMSRMAKEQSIALNSPEYKLGIQQFEGNLKDIFEIAKRAKTPIIISDLTSNIKNHKPFINISGNSNPSANEVFKSAEQELKNGNLAIAKEKFYKAKDLDGLKFRAPSEINSVIHKLGKQFGYPIVKTDSAFSSISPDGIVGNNLMTDHLHPTIEGYKIIGRLFYEKMLETNNIPKTKRLFFSDADEKIRNDFDFTELDSVISHYRIIILKSDWPYVKTPKSVQQTLAEMNPQNFRDSLALKVIDNKLGWEKAHRLYASYLLKRNDPAGFRREIKAIMYQYPTINEYPKIAANEMLVAKQFDFALEFLNEYHRRTPDAFSAKWIGIINLSKNNLKTAKEFLEISRNSNPTDAQVLYNLAGANLLLKDFASALTSVENCLRANPNYPGAVALRNQIISLIRK